MKNSKRFLALTLVVIMLLAVFISKYTQNTSTMTSALAAEIIMEPTKQDSAGTDLDTEFVLTAKSPLDPKFIRENLKVEPTVDFTVKKDGKDKQKVLVLPREPLEPQKVYQFTLSSEKEVPLKWAFQTKGVFKVVSTLPRDQSTGVPIDTGIEITFSHLNFEKLPEFFSISPRVEGSFEMHKKTAVFVPRNLMPDTIYTITVKRGLPLADSSQVLEEDFVFQFETEGSATPKSNLSFDRDISEFALGNSPFFKFNYYSWENEPLPKEANVTVYNYKQAQDYINALEERQKLPYWAYRSRQKYREDTSKLKSTANFSVPIREFDYTKFIEFPEPLPAGYYLAETKIQNTTQQVWFQVTDLSLYSAVDKDNTYIWVNDLSTGSPVSRAKIQLRGSSKSTVTDDTGLAQLTTPQENSSGIYGLISKDNQEAVVAIAPWYQWDPEGEAQREFATNYWKYLYLDRSLYKPNDTVNFWGLIKPRADKIKPVDELTVILSSGGWRDDPVIESKKVKLNDFTFTDDIKLPNLSPGYYYLEVKAGDYRITSQGFEVQTYSKPSYQVDAEASKKALFVGDNMDFQVKATFFEGTPVPNMPLEYYILEHGNGRITTNNEGDATISFSPVYQKDQYSPIQWRRLFLTAKLPEAGEISGETSVIVLNNDISIDAKSKVGNGTATVEMVLDKLTVDKVNSGKADPWDKDAFKDKPVSNHPVKIKVYREVWEKQEEGQYYDFINKKVQPRYYYNYKKIPKLEEQLTTNQDGKASFTFPIKNKDSYVVELVAQDFKGNTAVQEVHVFGSSFSREYEYSWYNLEGKNSYKSGQQVQLTMKQNEGIIPSRPNSFLFLMARDGIFESRVQDTPNLSTVFDKKLIPNFWVRGVYFDGRYYHETYDCPVTYDKNEKALDIKVKTDKKDYRPKDTVEVELEVTDKNGRPVQAQVNLNLVDEALYAMQDQHVDILGCIYQDAYFPGIKTSFYSHEPPEMDLGGAEHGGEGGSERVDFRDTVLFKTLSTDKKGKVRVSFVVPDNLTSWRLTCQAVTADLSAATKTSPIVVRQPFFVDMITNDTYLAGDQPVILLRAYGDQLKAGTSIQYEAVLKREEKTKTQTLTGKAFSPTRWVLPPLEKGNYELTITGRTQEELRDSLTLNFSVVDSYMTRQQVDFSLLDEKLKLTGSKDSLTTLTFTDYQRSQYLDMLYRLQWATGSRIDQKIAPQIANELLREYFPDMSEMEEQEENLNLLQYQTPEGGIAILPYADAELELSSKLAALRSEYFDRSALADYFYKIAGDPKESRERSIIALYGLSALDEPILTELKVVSKEKNLTVKEQLYLTLAFIEIGDETFASQILKSILKEKGEDLETQFRIKVGQDQDSILEATALAAVAAAGLNFDEQNKLQTYLMENSSTHMLPYIEQLMFLKRTLPRLPKESVSFSYLLEGRHEKVVLKPGETFTLHLTPEKLATLKFGDIRGQVGLTSAYSADFKVSESSVDGVRITRKYENANDLIKIHISYEFGLTAPDGAYLITDYLPAGLKIVSKPYYRGIDDKDMVYPIEIDGQKITFAIYDKKKLSFNYYARVINPGEFKTEPAVLQHMTSSKIYSVSKIDGMSIK